MKRLIFAMMLFLALIINVWAEENQEISDPKELVQARTTYKNQIKASDEPITRKYLQQLDEMKKRLGGKGDAAGAMAVQKEIDSLKNDSKEDKTSEKKLKISDFTGDYDVVASNGFRTVLTVNKDNTCTTPGTTGKTKIEGDELVCLQTGGWVYRIKFSKGNELAGKSISPDKNQEFTLKLTRKLPDIPDIKFK